MSSTLEAGRHSATSENGRDGRQGHPPAPKHAMAQPRARRHRETKYMDIVVTQIAEGTWNLVDLLGRHVGIVEEAKPDEYRTGVRSLPLRLVRCINCGRAPFETCHAFTVALFASATVG